MIRSLGVGAVPFDLPEVPIEAIDFMRYAETAAAFDDVTRSGLLTLVEEGHEQSRRPNEIRTARFIPAVEFIQGNRLRMRVKQSTASTLGERCPRCLSPCYASGDGSRAPAVPSHRPQ